MRPLDFDGRTKPRTKSGQRTSLGSQRLVLPVAADELLDATKRFVVGHLHGRMLGKIGGRGMQHAADAAVERNLTAADRVDRYPG